MALYWRPIIAILIPIVLLPVFLLNDSKATKWLYVILIMTLFWITKAIPHPITSFIPIGLFPLLGVMDTVEICKLYAQETVFTFLGSLIIASSVEQCNLHKRIALKILCHVKCSHRRLHFVFMAVTMFISMWIQNFLVIAMMSPLCLAILEEFEVQGETTIFKPKTNEDTDEVSRPTPITMCYFLGITYAATFGGSGSLLGTPSNLVFKGIFETYFPSGPEIDSLRFFLYCAPIMLLNTLLTWLWLQFLYMGLFRPKSEQAAALFVSDNGATAVKENIILNYKAMGGLTAAEIQVAILLVAFQFVLAFRSSQYIQGWDYISIKTIKDASPTIIFVILFFIVPFTWNCFKCCRKTSDDETQDGSHSLLTWTFVRRKLPWGLVSMLGAGIVIANSGKSIKFQDMIPFIDASVLNNIQLLLAVCLVCQIFTEFVTNIVAANIILPFLAALCQKNERNPLFYMFPAALSISMAFHSSIGTPGNAYTAGLINIPKKELFFCGIGPSIITLLTYWTTFPTYGAVFYPNLNTFQDWTKTRNITGN